MEFVFYEVGLLNEWANVYRWVSSDDELNIETAFYKH